MKTVQADYLIILGSLDKRVGMEMGTSGSKEGPSPVARAATHSTTVGVCDNRRRESQQKMLDRRGRGWMATLMRPLG
jgi:hypothetical protein